MNVGFDQLSSEEKNGFLRKLQMLTVGNKKSPKSAHGETTQSPAGRILKKFVPSHRLSATKSTEQPGRFNMFSRSNKKSSESDKPTDSQQNQPRKQSARRLNFLSKDSESKPNLEIQKNKAVAAMTREYEKIVNKGVPMPINRAPGLQAPGGSLETPTSSPVNIVSTSSNSSPDKISDASNSSSRERWSDSNDDYLNKKRNLPRHGGFTSNRSTSNASWQGELPPRDYTSPTFSRKIFVGGVPWDITENALKDSFGEFGACAVEWPGQEARYRSGQANMTPPNANLRNQSKVSWKFSQEKKEKLC